jgi:hypothetical protein
MMTAAARSKDEPMKPDHLAIIEHVQTIIAAADAPLDRLEAARLDLQRVIAAGEADLEASAARRKIELSAAVPVAELSKKLASLDANDIEIRRRLEIAGAVISQIEPRIAEAREHEGERLRRVRYDAAANLHAETTSLVRTFLENVAPAALAALAAYHESERATRAVNADLPQGASSIRSIEAERIGDLTKPKVTERKFQAFVHGKDMVGEVGKVEAFKNGNGNWAVYFRSNAVQGDWTVGPCTIVDYIEVTTERYEPRPLESLATSLRVPAFDAPAPKPGRSERRVVPASAQPDPLAVAAE